MQATMRKAIAQKIDRWDVYYAYYELIDHTPTEMYHMVQTLMNGGAVMERGTKVGI